MERHIRKILVIGLDIGIPSDGTIEYWAAQIVQRVRSIFDAKRPTAV